MLALWLRQAPPAPQTSNLLKPQLASALGESRSSTGTTCSLKGVAPYLNSPSTTGGAFASHFPTAASCNVSMPLPDQAAETRPEQRPTPTPGLCKGERELHTRLFPAFSGMDPGLRTKMSRREVGHFRTKLVTQILAP